MCAGRSPRGSRVFFHGPPVLPTAASCAAWMERTAPGSSEGLDDYEWRRQAFSLGAGGGLRDPESRWLETLLRSVATGMSATPDLCHPA